MFSFQGLSRTSYVIFSWVVYYYLFYQKRTTNSKRKYIGALGQFRICGLTACSGASSAIAAIGPDRTVVHGRCSIQV